MPKSTDFAQSKTKSFEIVQKRKIWYCISLAIILPGLIFLIINGFNLGIDFTGGNLYQIKFDAEYTADQVRAAVDELVEQTPSVQTAEDGSFLVRVSALSEEDSALLLENLTSEMGSHTILRSDSIGGVIGRELTRSAQIALIIALILMLVYISFRFKVNFALAAVIPLIHDVLIMCSVVVLFRIEIASSFIAAILTIVGYAINSTIVIFDRIRENTGNYVKEGQISLINTSVRQTLARSINTNLAVMILLVSLLFFGGSTTRDFILILIVGVIAGTYSSVFLAGSFLYDITNLIERKNARRSPRSASATSK